MGHLIAAAGAVEVAVCALAIHHGEMPVNANLRERDPDCDLNLVIGAPRRAARAHGDVELVRLRRLEQLRRAAPSRRSRRRRAPRLTRATAHDATPRVVITGTGAVCAAGMDAGRRSSTPCAPAARAIAPITQWDTTRLAGARSPARSPTSTPRALVDDRKLHKLIRRTDLFGLYAAGRAIEASGIVAHRDDARRRRRRGVYSDRTGVYVGSGGGNYQNQYDYLPADDRGAAATSPAFGRELANTVNPMWLLRTLPNNVLGHIGIQHGLKGTERLHHQPQRRRRAGGHRGVRGAAPGEADRAVAVGHDTPIEPQMVLYYHRVGLLASETLRPFDARHDGSLFGEGAGALMLETEASARRAAPPVLGEVLGGGYACEAEGLLAIRDDGDGVARAIAQALDDAGIARRRRRHDRRARQRHAAVRRVGGRGDPRASSAHASPPVTAFKWAFGHLIAAAGTLDAVLALAALRRGVVPGIATLDALDPACAPLPVGARHGARARQHRAGPQPRLRGDQRRAGRSRGLNPAPAAMTPTAAGSRRCGIDTVEIARIERLLAETPAGDLAQALFRAGTRRRRRRARARREPRRALRRQGSVRQALPARDRAGADRGRRLLGRARQLRRAAGRRAAPRARNGCWAGTGSPTSRCRSRTTATSASAVALPEPAHDRVAARRPAPLPLRCRCAATSSSPTCGASTATTSTRPRSRALAQAHYGHLWRLARRVPEASAGCRPRAKRALVRVENIDAFVAAQSRRARACSSSPATSATGRSRPSPASATTREVRGRFHFVRRAIKPRWLDRARHPALQPRGLRRASPSAARSTRCSTGSRRATPSCSRSTSTRGRPTASRVDFFGHPAWTFKSLAIIALATGAPVLPATSWREPDGRHVLRFEDAARRPSSTTNTERGDPPQHARLQRGAGAARAAPPGAVVLGAPALEDGRAEKAVTRVPAGDAARAAARTIDAGGLRAAAPATRRRR